MFTPAEKLLAKPRARGSVDGIPNLTFPVAAALEAAVYRVSKMFHNFGPNYLRSQNLRSPAIQKCLPAIFPGNAMAPPQENKMLANMESFIVEWEDVVAKVLRTKDDTEQEWEHRSYLNIQHHSPCRRTQYESEKIAVPS
jgi:hypothetical protein